MTRAARRYLVAPVDKALCNTCHVRKKQEHHHLCWPCERARHSEWMWTA